jgi:hypothetical protein
MIIGKYCISLLLISNFLHLPVHAADAASTAYKAEHIGNICATDRLEMDQAVDFLKKEITFHTSLPTEGLDSWIPEPLMNEKISLSYDNLSAARGAVDLDCKSADYVASLLPKIQAGESLGEDGTVIDETFRQLTNSVTSWKKEYITFWQVLTETIQQYKENAKAAISPTSTNEPNIPAQ